MCQSSGLYITICQVADICLSISSLEHLCFPLEIHGNQASPSLVLGGGSVTTTMNHTTYHMASSQNVNNVSNAKKSKNYDDEAEDSSWPRFMVITSKDQSENISKISPFVLSKKHLNDM